MAGPWDESLPGGMPNFGSGPFPSGAGMFQLPPQMGPQPQGNQQQTGLAIAPRVPTPPPPTPPPPALGQGGPNPAWIPTPQPPPVNMPAPYNPPMQTGLTKKQARYSDIAQGLQAFQNAMQRNDAAKQQKLQTQGMQAVAMIQQAAQNPDRNAAAEAQAHIIQDNAAALRAVGVNVPSDPKSIAKPGVFQRIMDGIGALGGVPNRRQQNQPVSMDQARQTVSRMPGLSAGQQLQQAQTQDAANVAAETAKLDPAQRARILAGFEPKPADIQKIEAAGKVKNEFAKRQQAVALAKSGFKFDGDEIVPMDANELSLPQQQRGDYEKIRKEYMAAQQELVDARTEVEKAKLDPASPMNAIAQKKLELAEGNLIARQQMIQVFTERNKINQQRVTASVAKHYEPALDSDTRLSVMNQGLKNPNAQNDVAMLFNHMGMTMGAQKGARMTDAEINRAISARSLPQGALAALEKTGLTPDFIYRVLQQDPSQLPPGGFLTPQQRQQMVELGVEMRQKQWDKARRISVVSGMEEEPIPDPDLPPVQPLTRGKNAGQPLTQPVEGTAPKPKGAHGKPGVPNGAVVAPDPNYPVANSLQEVLQKGMKGFTDPKTNKRYDIRNGMAFEVKD